MVDLPVQLDKNASSNDLGALVSLKESEIYLSSMGHEKRNIVLKAWTN